MTSDITIIQNFASIHFESQVIPFIAENIVNRLPGHNENLFIEDIQHLGSWNRLGIYNCVICGQLLNKATNINESLIKVHDLLKPGGIFVGRVETLQHRKRRLASFYNKFSFKVVNLYDFIFKRVLKKLKGFRFFYKKFKIIKHHILSQCEALGRLRYCGFDIVAVIGTDDCLYFITVKKSKPSNEIPGDSIFVKIPKVGKDGRIIYCHKLRTMHAYAKYLHDYILNNYEIDRNGKVVGDFRKTDWGKFLRNTWLDEMPQILNIIKGDLSFIGLRPLSQAFLSLYPEDWRKERIKIKPGFVPPYYADCPKTFEDIIESEKRYYYLKKKHPITTDIIYLIRVIASFVSGRARTG